MWRSHRVRMSRSKSDEFQMSVTSIWESIQEGVSQYLVPRPQVGWSPSTMSGLRSRVFGEVCCLTASSSVTGAINMPWRDPWPSD